MNRGQLVAEVKARGFDYLSDARAQSMVQQACSELDGMLRWPYLLASVSGAAPLAVADLGAVRQVVDATGVVLTGVQVDEARAAYGDLTVTGVPSVWYLAYSAGVASVCTYPVGSSVTAHYWKVPADLAGDTDVPAAPVRWHGLIVDIACRLAAAERQDWAGVAQLQAQVDRRVGLMAADLLRDQGASFIPAVGDDN